MPRWVVHAGKGRWRHCVDGGCGMRAKVEGRSKSSLSDREAMAGKCAMGAFEEGDARMMMNVKVAVPKFVDSRWSVRVQLNSQSGPLPLTTTRDKYFEHFILQSFRHLLSNLATVYTVKMYGYPGMFTTLCDKNLANMCRCPGLQWPSRLCWPTRHGASRYGYVDELRQYRIYNACEKILTMRRTARRHSSSWRSSSPRCRECSRPTSTRRTARPTFGMASAHEHA